MFTCKKTESFGFNNFNQKKSIFFSLIQKELIIWILMLFMLFIPTYAFALTETTNATEVICGSFEDVLQTRDDNSKIVHSGDASAIVYDSPDCTLNTGDVDFGEWQELTCEGGIDDEATASGSYGTVLNPTYDGHTPAVASISSSPSTSTTDITVTSSQTLSEATYNNMDIGSGGTGFLNVILSNVRQINSLDFTTNNSVTFSTSTPYNLEIGSVGIVNNGSGNSLTTSTIPKSIKINTLELPGNTTIDFEATQTIKFETFKIGRAGTDVTLKAPYVNINSLTQSNSSGGTSHITIIADYVDIGTLTLDQQATIEFQPYTTGQRVLFQANSISASSSSGMIVDSGNYYTNSFDIPGTSDVSSIAASDENQLINFYINGDFNPGNNPGINSIGNSGNYGDLPPENFILFINGDLNTGGGGTTFNATVYVEGSSTMGSPTYLKGALSVGGDIVIGNGSRFYYDQGISDAGWGVCEQDSYCSAKDLTEGFHMIDPDDGNDTNSFEIFCYEDSDSQWHDLIALPIKNNSNNFLFNNNATSSNYYNTSSNPRTAFHAIEINANTITYSGTLNDGVTPRPHIDVVISDDADPYSITTDGKNYKVMGSSFSNINLIGTPFKIEWDQTSDLIGCDESKLRKALGQAVKYNTINSSSGTSNDGQSRCELVDMKLSLLDDYQFLTYGSEEVLQHSCKEMATYIPNNIFDDASVDGHFNILTTEPAYVTGIPTTNGSRDSSQDIGAKLRPLTVYCKYQTDLAYVWTFLTALDGQVTQYKTDLVSKQDTCSQLGLYFYVPNSKETFNRVREYLKAKKTGVDGWEEYTGTIEEKIKALHSGNVYYLPNFKDVKIWPYGPLGVYLPTPINTYGFGRAPMHNIDTMSNYADSMGAKGWVSILGAADLNKTDDWWIADIGAGLEITKSNGSHTYSPSGSHPTRSATYDEPNGNYTHNAWLNFLFDEEGWVYHNDDWYANYPYYDYMCMSETNYDTATRYSLVPGFFNVIERSKNTPPDFSNNYISTQIVNKNIELDLLLYSIDPNTLLINTGTLNEDENKSVGVFLSTVDNDATPVPIKFLGEYENFAHNNGRIEINDFVISSASPRVVVQFYYCNAADVNWTTCWDYNGNEDSPTLSALGGGDTSDAYDDFAIRPDKFDFNIIGTSPYKAGKDYNVTFSALDAIGGPSNGYDEIIPFEYNETKLGCLPGTFSPSISSTDFASGIKSIDLHYSEVGVLNIKMEETLGSEYAIIDINDTSDADRLIDPYDQNISFTPDHFKLSVRLTDGANNFTYISKDLNMSAILDINITAQEADANDTTKNYNSSCYAKTTDYNISYANITISPTGALNSIIYFENNTSTSNANNINSDINLTSFPNTIFSTDDNGSATIKLLINFDRNETKPVQPFDFHVQDINVTDSDIISGGVNLDKNSTFYYGRVHGPDQRFDDDHGVAQVYYEIYCDECNATNIGNESIDSINWFTNTLHVNKDGNVSSYTSSANVKFDDTVYTGSNVKETLNNYASINSGDENITVVAPDTPYKDKISMTSSSWLEFSPKDFMVEFYGGGEWAGQGIQGKTVDINISKRQNKRLDW